MASHVSGPRPGAAARSSAKSGTSGGWVVAGFALFTGATWARVVGVGLAGLAMLANFLWIPYAPFWAIVLIAINAFVIWALCIAPSPSEN